MKSMNRRVASSGWNLRAQNRQARARQQLLRAVVETLEQRQYLTITPTISGQSEINEGTNNYQLNLTYTGSAPVSWKIDWGDGSDPDNDGVVGQTVPGSWTSAPHTYPDGPNKYRVTAEAVDSSGQAYAATTTVNASWGLDAAFGNSGTLEKALPSGFTYETSAVQSDGKLLVAGRMNNHFALARYTTGGILDTSFGGIYPASGRSFQTWFITTLARTTRKCSKSNQIMYARSSRAMLSSSRTSSR